MKTEKGACPSCCSSLLSQLSLESTGPALERHFLRGNGNGVKVVKEPNCLPYYSSGVIVVACPFGGTGCPRLSSGPLTFARTTAPISGKIHTQSPLRYDHWKPGSPGTMLFVSPHVRKQYMLSKLKVSRRTKNISTSKDQGMRLNTTPYALGEASISAKNPKKVTRYQGQNQGEPNAQ